MNNAPASWTAVTSRRSHRFALRAVAASFHQAHDLCESESGDFPHTLSPQSKS